MSAVLDQLPPDGSPHREDHFVHLWDVSWADYERILDIRGDRSGPRIQYLEGQLEIMSPSRYHEGIKSTIGRLVEVWCLERDVEFSTFGSWTVKDETKKSGVEPDECWILGDLPEKPERPDLAIEVIWTSGGIRKLELYRKLGVREVWTWKRGVLTAHRLVDEQYVETPESTVLPGIDLALIAKFATTTPTSRAIRELRAALGS